MKDALMQLLRIGLWSDKPQPEIIDFPSLSDQDWEQLYKRACQQTVEGIVFDSFKFLEDSQLPPQELLIRWTVRVDQIERRNREINQVMAGQSEWFEEIGFCPILLKGFSVGMHYPEPVHRVSGDIDWFFQEQEYEKIRRILEHEGQVFDSLSLRSLSYKKGGVIIEHHKDTFNLTNPFIRKFLREFEQECLDSQCSYSIEENGIAIGKVNVLPMIPRIIQVNIHILKHLLAFGIGLRQICDAARLYDFFSQQENYRSESISALYREMGIYKWTHLLHDILVKHFGLPADCLPYPIPKGTDSDWMMEEIWQSGNFGFHDERFVDGKKNSMSIRPGSTLRVWRSLKNYFPIARVESIFFILQRLYAKPFVKKING